MLHTHPTGSTDAQFHLLVVEDDPTLNQQITELLEDAGFRVDSYYDGETALIAASKGQHHLMVLDLMLPERDGMSVLALLRKVNQIPVIIVTAKGAEEERITGLKQGADDYITKPFHPDELLLRIEAILRRCNQSASHAPPSTLLLDGLCLEVTPQTASVHNHILDLTPIQFKLLLALLQNRGEVLTKAFLYQTVLNKSFGVHDRSLDMHLSRVRKKLNQASWNGERLQTVHGKGYRIS